MPRDRVILACEECGRRNYNVDKNKKVHPERIEFKKFCPHCNKHTIHRETR